MLILPFFCLFCLFYSLQQQQQQQSFLSNHRVYKELCDDHHGGGKDDDDNNEERDGTYIVVNIHHGDDNGRAGTSGEASVTAAPDCTLRLVSSACYSYPAARTFQHIVRYSTVRPSPSTSPSDRGLCSH